MSTTIGATHTTTTAAPSSYLPVRNDWLERRVEATLEPGLPIIDPHHHLWERPGWETPDCPATTRGTAPARAG